MSSKDAFRSNRRARGRRRKPGTGASSPAPHSDASLHGGASIYDVAERAGVSIVTVSRVFNDYPHVSSLMRERVLTASRLVGYTPRLVSKRNLLAVVIGHLDHLGAGDYKTRLLLHVVRVAADCGYLVEFIPHTASALATQHLVDGLLEVGLTTQEVLRMDRLPPVPKVAINKADVDNGWSFVCSDHEEEARLAVDHLAAHGHRRIALVLDEPDGWGVTRRRAGYEAAMHRHTNGACAPLVLYGSDLLPGAIAQRICEAGCTALVNLSDNFGFAVMDSLVNALQRRVPQDLSLICLENASVSPFLSPRLTTIAQPLEEIATLAVHGLVRLIEKGGRFENHVRSQLMVRHSVAPPAS